MKFLVKLFKLVPFVLLLLVPNPLAAQDHGDEGAPPPPQTNLFADFRPVMVAVIREHQIRGHLGVDFALAVTSADAMTEIDLLRPRLRDSIQHYLAGLASARINPRRPLDLDLVSSYIQKAVDEILGDGVAEVLIITASVTPRD
jgi:flagellar basal body-associated protein FliL